MYIYAAMFIGLLAFVVSIHGAILKSDLVLIQGDILLTPEQQERRLFYKRRGGSRHKRMAVMDENKRWRNNTIYYTVALAYYSEREIEEMKWAFREFEKETCLKFRSATRSTPNYAMVRSGPSGCNAQLGQAYNEPAAQSVNLGSGCRHYGLYLHEFGHTIGLYHEHQHPDRDTEIDVHWDNVDPDMAQWFKHESEPFETFGAPYDIQSVMHYEDTSFSKDGKLQTMTTKDPKKQKYLVPVYLKDMSFYDAWKINAMYKCASHCERVNCPTDTFVNKDCKCVTKKDFAARRCFDIRSDCASYKDRCVTERYWLYKYCRKTCDVCYEAI